METLRLRYNTQKCERPTALPTFVKYRNQENESVERYIWFSGNSNSVKPNPVREGILTDPTSKKPFHSYPLEDILEPSSVALLKDFRATLPSGRDEVLEQRIRTQIRTYLVRARTGKLTPQWRSFALNHRDEIMRYHEEVQSLRV